MALGEFRRRFRLLSSDVNARPGSPVTDERRAIEDMLLTVDIDPALYRVGQSQVSKFLLQTLFAKQTVHEIVVNCGIPRDVTFIF